MVKGNIPRKKRNYPYLLSPLFYHFNSVLVYQIINLWIDYNFNGIPHPVPMTINDLLFYDPLREQQISPIHLIIIILPDLKWGKCVSAWNVF